MNQYTAISADELRGKLVKVMLFRVVAISTLLGATLVRSLQRDPSFGASDRVFIYLIIAVYAASMAYAALLRLWRNLWAQTFIQVAGDLLLATFICYYSGHNESVFTILFPFYVIVAAILGYRVGAFLAAAAGSLAVAALAIDAHASIFPIVPGMLSFEAAPSLPQIVYQAFINITAIFMIAALSSYLAEQIRRTGAALEVRTASLMDLTALHEAIVRSIPSGVLTFDPGGAVSFANAAACRTLGIDAVTFVGRPAREIFPRAQALMGDETVWRDPAGASHVLAYQTGALHDHTGEPSGGMVVFQDVTSLRNMEEAVRRAERLAALGKVAAGLAHEIRNPLAAITGSIELLQRQASPAGGDAGALMRIVSDEAERLNDLIGKFLLYARPSPPRFEDADLSRLVAETVKVFRFDSDIGSDVSIQERIGPGVGARLDPGQIKQVLWNLLRNAAQAVTGPGTITITLRPGDRDGVAAVLEVADDGAGIPKEDLTRVFDPFYTTKDSGTGLGLSIAYSIIEAHGGSIAVESEHGHGSRFTVRFGASREGVS